jgi:NADPH-dependent curcumin reductase
MSTSPAVNRRVTLANRPSGMPELSDFALVELPIEAPAEGSVTIAVEVLSIDAFIRTVMDERAFHGAAEIGGPLPALGVGRIMHSTVDSLQIGDAVFAPLGSQTVAELPAEFVRKLDERVAPSTAYLGGLGFATGVTAYIGMMEVAGVQHGDTVVVSAAAGAVGSLAGQLARIAGAGRVIGVAGGPEKCAWLVDEVGFDVAIDYRGGDLDGQLRAAAPDGVNVFFDNVGGEILDAVLEQIAFGARIVICGGISHYLDMGNVVGPRNYLKLAERCARMSGFAVNFYAERVGEAEAALAGWLAEGRLVMHEQHEHGIENFGHAVRTLLSGGNRGKLLLDLR